MISILTPLTNVVSRTTQYPFDDSALAPSGLQALCELPHLPVFNVRDYGARADGVADDTTAIRTALDAAQAAGGGIIYLPAGTYAVCRQANETPDWGDIFVVTGSHIVFIGDGPNRTHILGYCKHLKDPKTTWYATGNGYARISRFNMFQVTGSSNIQFRSLEICGNAGCTGNSRVGGDIATGDGWDIGHKGIRISRGNSTKSGNTLIFNCRLDKWRGEILYAGGDGGRIDLIKSHIFGSNASAISASGDVLISATTVGGDAPADRVRSGLENYSRDLGQKTVIENSAFNRATIVYLGAPWASLTVEHTKIFNCWYGILLSEFGYHITVEDCTFSRNRNAIITSILGLYPADDARYEGFAHILIRNNLFDHSGGAFINQMFSRTFTRPFDDVVFKNNTVSHGYLLGGGWVSSKPWTGLAVDGTHFGPGGYDADPGPVNNAAIWTNTARSRSNTQYTIHNATSKVWVNAFRPPPIRIIPFTDILVLNGDNNVLTPVTLDASVIGRYRAGYHASLVQGPASHCKWILDADTRWNNFASDIWLGPRGLEMTVDARGRFEVTDTVVRRALASSVEGDGTIAPAHSVLVEDGSSPTFDIRASAGSRVADVLVDGVSVGAVTSCTLHQVHESHDIVARFEADKSPMINAPGQRRRRE